jgi:CBS domain-containing membrane protein
VAGVLAGELKATMGDDATKANEDEERESVLELEVLPKTVGEVMTKRIVTLKETDTIRQARTGMEQFKFHHFPVVADDGKLIGLVTRADILHAASSWLSERAAERDKIILELPVSRIMTKEPKAVLATEALLSAARTMTQTHLGCLLVVDGDDKLVGLLTEGDYVKLAIRLLSHGTRPPPPRSNAG